MGVKRPIRVGEKGGTGSCGFSLLELMSASAILIVGILGCMVVMGVASANNGRSKFHTTAATLAGSTMEKILAIPSSATGAAAQTQITDCAGTQFTIDTNAGPAGSGADLIPPGGAFSGLIDFSKPPIPNYSMTYSMCAPSGGQYDVRWRIDPGPTPSTQLVTVAAKSINVNQGAILTLPYNVHHLRGDF